MSLTAKDIAEIARLLDESHFSSLDLRVGDFKLRIRRDVNSGKVRWLGNAGVGHRGAGGERQNSGQGNWKGTQ